MKILLATSSFRGGGIGSYAHEIINNYSKSHEISVIVGDDSKFPINQIGVKVYKYDCDDLSLNNAKKVLSLINETIKPDVVINSCAKLISLITPYLSKNIKVISVSHSLKYQELTIATRNRKYINTIVALSDSCKRYMLKKYRLESEKVKIVYNFVRSIADSREIRERKKNTDVISIVYAGGTAPAKSPEIVLKTLKELVKTDLDFQFYWFGGLTPTMKRIQPYNSIEDIFVSDKRVNLMGRIEKKKAEELIANANIFFSPSRREGCPMTLLEAMRVGTIALVADYDIANKEIIIDDYNGFVVNHKSIPTFVEKIKYIIENHKQLSYIYDNSYETFDRMLSFECWKKSMDDIIAENNSCKRKNIFSAKLYCINRFFFKLKLKYDKWDLIISEYITSGLYFFVEFFKSKQYVSKK